MKGFFFFPENEDSSVTEILQDDDDCSFASAVDDLVGDVVDHVPQDQEELDTISVSSAPSSCCYLTSVFTYTAGHAVSSQVESIPEEEEEDETSSRSDNDDDSESAYHMARMFDPESSESESWEPENSNEQADYVPIDSKRMMSRYRDLDEAGKAFQAINWDAEYHDPFYGGFLQDLERRFTDPLSHEVEYLHPFSAHARINDFDMPTTRDIARLEYGEEKKRWLEAMDVEIQQLWEKGTFRPIDKSEVPKGAQILGSTWVFKRKRHPDGLLDKLKARCCLRGDEQIHTTEREDVYAPVVDWSSLRLLLTMSLQFDWCTRQIDFKNAFVQATLPEPLYMRIPQGYSKKPEFEDKVLKVTKSLYGDKRAPRMWYKHMTKILNTMGFFASPKDNCLFLNPDRQCTFVLYVDDGIFFHKESAVIDEMLEEFKSHNLDFTVEGDLTSYLGIKIDRQGDSIHLSQPALIKRVMELVGLSEETNPVATPAVAALGKDLEMPAHDQDRFLYRSAIGMINFLVQNTRPDMTFACHQAARFSNDPRRSHTTAVVRMGKYLRGNAEKGLTIKASKSLKLDCYCDADFAGLWGAEKPEDPKCSRSRSGYVIMLGGQPIYWSSKLQTETALSTLESEYICLSQATRTLIALRETLKAITTTMGLEIPPEEHQSTIYEDNAATVLVANSNPPRLSPRSKTLAVKYHWFKDWIYNGTIIVKHVSTDDQLADIFTKALSKDKFEANRLGLMGW